MVDHPIRVMTGSVGPSISAFMQDDPEETEQRGLSQGADVSDLIGVKLTLGLALWFLVVLACFFFVGPLAGIIAIIGGVRPRTVFGGVRLGSGSALSGDSSSSRFV